MPLLTKPLGRQERQAVTLRRQGKTNQEIADVMLITTGHVSAVLYTAKQKGAEFPPAKRGNQKDRDCVPIARLANIRAQLRAAGYGYGLYAVIAERVGMTTNAVRVRLWKHDHKPQGVSQ
jgi:hypothetical protein